MDLVSMGGLETSLHRNPRMTVYVCLDWSSSAHLYPYFPFLQGYWLYWIMIHFNDLILPCGHAQSYLTLCNPIDCSLPSSSVHTIFQARILEWVTISVPRGSSQHRDRIYVSWFSYIANGFVTAGPSGKALFNLNDLFKEIIFKYCDILWYCGLGPQHMNLVGVDDTLYPIIDAFLLKECWYISRPKPTVLKEF